MWLLYHSQVVGIPCYFFKGEVDPWGTTKEAKGHCRVAASASCHDTGGAKETERLQSITSRLTTIFDPVLWLQCGSIFLLSQDEQGEPWQDLNNTVSPSFANRSCFNPGGYIFYFSSLEDQDGISTCAKTIRW